MTQATPTRKVARPSTSQRNQHDKSRGGRQRRNLTKEDTKSFRAWLKQTCEEFGIVRASLAQSRDEKDDLYNPATISRTFGRMLLARLERRVVPSRLSALDWPRRLASCPVAFKLVSVPKYSELLSDAELRSRGFDPNDIKKYRFTNREIAQCSYSKPILMADDKAIREYLMANGVATAKNVTAIVARLKNQRVYENVTYRPLAGRTGGILAIMKPYEVRDFQRKFAPRVACILPSETLPHLARVLSEMLVADGAVAKNRRQTAEDSLRFRLSDISVRGANAFANELGCTLDDEFDGIVGDAKANAARVAPDQEMTMLLHAIANIVIPETLDTQFRRIQ